MTETAIIILWLASGFAGAVIGTIIGNIIARAMINRGWLK